MKLVAITGIDGTGKTTLAKHLVRVLQARGFDSKYFYGRSSPIFSRAIMVTGRRLLLRGRSPWVDYETYASAKQRQATRRPLRAIFITAILLDTAISLCIKLLPNMRSSRILVADRYLYDTVITDLAAHLAYSTEHVQLTLDRLFRCFPRPDVAVLLDVDEDLAFSRKRDIPHRDYLRERRSHYLSLEDRPEIIRLDGSLPPVELLRQVEHLLSERGLTSG